MDNLESLKKEEEQLIKNRNVSVFSWAILLTAFFVIQFLIDVGLIVFGIISVSVLVDGIIYWRADNKLKKIRKEISALEKE
jgi:uncharacterized membrane protein